MPISCRIYIVVCYAFLNSQLKFYSTAYHIGYPTYIGCRFNSRDECIDVPLGTNKCGTIIEHMNIYFKTNPMYISPSCCCLKRVQSAAKKCCMSFLGTAHVFFNGKMEALRRADMMANSEFKLFISCNLRATRMK